jgi:hypothetical protein
MTEAEAGSATQSCASMSLPYLRVADLSSIAKAHDLDASGRRRDLLKRVLDAGLVASEQAAAKRSRPDKAAAKAARGKSSETVVKCFLKKHINREALPGDRVGDLVKKLSAISCYVTRACARGSLLCLLHMNRLLSTPGSALPNLCSPTTYREMMTFDHKSKLSPELMRTYAMHRDVLDRIRLPKEPYSSQALSHAVIGFTTSVHNSLWMNHERRLRQLAKIEALRAGRPISGCGDALLRSLNSTSPDTELSTTVRRILGCDTPERPACGSCKWAKRKEHAERVMRLAFWMQGVVDRARKWSGLRIAVEAAASELADRDGMDVSKVRSHAWRCTFPRAQGETNDDVVAALGPSMGSVAQRVRDVLAGLPPHDASSDVLEAAEKIVLESCGGHLDISAVKKRRIRGIRLTPVFSLQRHFCTVDGSLARDLAISMGLVGKDVSPTDAFDLLFDTSNLRSAHKGFERSAVLNTDGVGACFHFIRRLRDGERKRGGRVVMETKDERSRVKALCIQTADVVVGVDPGISNAVTCSTERRDGSTMSCRLTRAGIRSATGQAKMERMRKRIRTASAEEGDRAAQEGYAIDCCSRTCSPSELRRFVDAVTSTAERRLKAEMDPRLARSRMHMYGRTRSVLDSFWLKTKRVALDGRDPKACRVLLAYGDAGNCCRGQQLRSSARRVLDGFVAINEFNTSKMCPHCGTQHIGVFKLEGCPEAVPADDLNRDDLKRARRVRGLQACPGERCNLRKLRARDATSALAIRLVCLHLTTHASRPAAFQRKAESTSVLGQVAPACTL